MKPAIPVEMRAPSHTLGFEVLGALWQPSAKIRQFISPVTSHHINHCMLSWTAAKRGPELNFISHH